MKDEMNEDSSPKIVVGYLTSTATPNVMWIKMCILKPKLSKDLFISADDTVSQYMSIIQCC